MNKPYSVALLESHDLPARDRIDAEVRFARELERSLGGDALVIEVYLAWISSSESNASEIDKETAAKAVRWPRAFDAANRAGFSKLGDIGAAHFEIRLERHAA